MSQTTYRLFEAPILFYENHELEIYQPDDFEAQSYEDRLWTKLDAYSDEIVDLIEKLEQVVDDATLSEGMRKGISDDIETFRLFNKEIKACLNNFDSRDTLIHEDDIDDHIEEGFCESHSWADDHRHWIDWDAVLRDYKMDFSVVEIGSETFYMI